MNNCLKHSYLICIFLIFGFTTNTKYIRKEWGYPIDVDKDCQNTRAEILISRSLKPVTFKNDKKCVVLTGLWQDFYFSENLIEASKVQIDHLVPLKNAFESGGNKWSRKEKKRFANDPENLVITSAKTNQQKGALGIESWLPIDRRLACRYLKKWIEVKTKYRLAISKEEEESVSSKVCIDGEQF